MVQIMCILRNEALAEETNRMIAKKYALVALIPNVQNMLTHLAAAP